MNGTSSVPWRCNVCNSEHPVGTGGICQRCRKFACNRHLETVLLEEGKKLAVCTTCLRPDDTVEHATVTGLKKLLRWLMPH